MIGKWVVGILLVLLFWACDSKLSDSAIVILYDNDVHCAVHGYAAFAAVAELVKKETPYVTKISCGDFIQGEVVASATRGMAIIDIMNRVGYDIVTLGNHEFDFGVERMTELMDSLHSAVVCANFRNLASEESYFKPYKIVAYGDVRIAYLGVTTTTTPINTSPQTFRDEAGNILYDFGFQGFYNNIQGHIDEAFRDGADYVVAISHLGDIPYGEHPTSFDLINNTSGINLLLDGHAHSVIADTGIVNILGDTVLMTSSGTRFQYIGKVTLSTNGKFTSELIPVEENRAPVDISVRAYVDSIVGRVEELGKRIVGVSLVDLHFSDSEDNRISYVTETSIGDFCADAFRAVCGADVAVVNGGGIRSSIYKGELSFNDLYAIFPFNNSACIAKITGKQLLDAMEFSVSWLPEEDANFMQVSGMRFDVDPMVPSPVMYSLDGMFSHIGPGKRRVAHLQIYDSRSEVYKDVEPDKEYIIAGSDYLLKNLGASGVFRHAVPLNCNFGQEVELLVSYLHNHLDGVIPISYIAPSNRICIK